MPHASGEVRQQIDKELLVANDHLKQARQIKEQLMERPSERVSRKPNP